jgi:hypothetical protein
MGRVFTRKIRHKTRDYGYGAQPYLQESATD